MSAVAINAAAPPITASMTRKSGASVGVTMTMSDWIVAAIVKLAWPDRNRATTSVIVSVRASCHQPVPVTASRSSATSTPSSIPNTVSSTRRGRASRTSPRLDTATVAASSGAGCPSA